MYFYFDLTLSLILKFKKEAACNNPKSINLPIVQNSSEIIELTSETDENLDSSLNKTVDQNNNNIISAKKAGIKNSEKRKLKNDESKDCNKGNKIICLPSANPTNDTLNDQLSTNNSVSSKTVQFIQESHQTIKSVSEEKWPETLEEILRKQWQLGSELVNLNFKFDGILF
jgi:hypothetical protein